MILITFNILVNIHAQTYIYWTDADDNVIRRANISTRVVETIIYSQNTPRGITIDYEHGRLYFADGEHNSITGSFLNGDEVEYINEVTEPIDVCLDKRFGFIYYSDVTEGTISRINTNSLQNEVIISNQEKPSFLDLDIVNNHIYYATKHGDISIIYRSDLDGSNIKEIINENGYIVGIAVDAYNKKLYWLNRKTSKVLSSNLDGSDKIDIADASPVCISIELDNINGILYWCEKDNSRIQMVNTDGTEFSTFLDNINIPGSIAIDIKNYCAKAVEVFDTTFITVTDTLLINVTFTGTDNIDYLNTIKVYPNPAKDYVVIDLGENFTKISKYEVSIIDETGKTVYNSEFNKRVLKIKVDDFIKAGLFFIQIKNDVGKLITVKKLVLE